MHRGCAWHVVVRMALLRATTASTPLRLPPARHCDLNSNQLAMGDQQPSGNAPRAKRNRKPTTPFVPGETALRSRPTLAHKDIDFHVPKTDKRDLAGAAAPPGADGQSSVSPR